MEAEIQVIEAGNYGLQVIEMALELKTLHLLFTTNCTSKTSVQDSTVSSLCGFTEQTFLRAVVLWKAQLFCSLKFHSLARGLVTNQDTLPPKLAENVLKANRLFERQKICKMCDQTQAPQTKQSSVAVLDESVASACLQQLQISESRGLGGKCFCRATHRLHHPAFVLTLKVDKTIVTPRQINLWRLKGE